jgi:hypothetical protein
MTSLQKYIDNQSQHIEDSLQEIAELQQQLNDLQQKLRIDQQVHQAQKTAEAEVSKTLNHLKKLFKDLCGIYEPEVLDDLANEIADMAEEVKESYDEYAESGRFLNGAEEDETEEQEQSNDSKDYPLIFESLPSEEDDETILTSSQVETIIRHKNEDIHTFLKRQLGINRRVKKLSTLTQKISEQEVTRKQLEQFLQAADLTFGVKTLRLNGATNGHGKP